MFGRTAPRDADVFRSGPAPSAHPDPPGDDTLALRLRAALDAIGEAIFICDAAGDTIFENQAAAELKAVGPGNALVAQAVHDAIGQALSGHRPEGNLELIAAPNRRTLSVRAVPIAGPAGPEGALAVVEDISERLRLEAVRRDFVANVSHELKTPVGALALLAETLDGETSPEVVARLARRLGHEAERLSAIIDDLLDLSRIEANEAPDRKLLSVRDLVDEALNRLRTAATGLEVTVEVEPIEPGLSLYGDHRDLVSAVANLVDNALKYSEPGGTVSVRATPRERNIDICVKDQGVGIPARDLERIFERFYRVDRARSRSTGGTGLGLSIVRNVAANHNGSVSVHSVEGEGSTFTLSLPLLEDQR